MRCDRALPLSRHKRLTTGNGAWWTMPHQTRKCTQCCVKQQQAIHAFALLSAAPTAESWPLRKTRSTWRQANLLRYSTTTTNYTHKHLPKLLNDWPKTSLWTMCIPTKTRLTTTVITMTYLRNPHSTPFGWRPKIIAATSRFSARHYWTTLAGLEKVLTARKIST
jgi:hypothetical protein